MTQNATVSHEHNEIGASWVSPLDWVATLERHREQLAEAEATLAVAEADVDLLRRTIKPLEELAALVTGAEHGSRTRSAPAESTIERRRVPRPSPAPENAANGRKTLSEQILGVAKVAVARAAGSNGRAAPGGGQSVADRIADALRGIGEGDVKAIAAKLGLPHKPVGIRLAVLASGGRIVRRVRPGVYALLNGAEISSVPQPKTNGALAINGHRLVKLADGKQRCGRCLVFAAGTSHFQTIDCDPV